MGVQYFFWMFGLDILGSGCGEVDMVVNSVGVLWFVDIKVVYIVDVYVYYYLWWWYYDGVYIVEGIDVDVCQLVVKLYGMGVGRKGMGEGVIVWCVVVDQLFQFVEVGYFFFLQFVGEGNCLVIVVEGYQIGYCLWFVGDFQFEVVQQVIENMCCVQFVGYQFVVYCCLVGFFICYQGDVIFLVKFFCCGDGQWCVIGQWNKFDLYVGLFWFV